MHNHDADSEAYLNRQIFNNSVKRKVMEDFCERRRKLIHKAVRSQSFDTVTCKDIRNINRNMHKARSSQMPLLPTDIEETHEALIAVQEQTSSKDHFLLVNDGKKYCKVFLKIQLTFSWFH